MKKYITLTIMVLTAAATTGFGEEFDCGHGCSIECPDGGGCVYSSTTHRCKTFCNHHGVLEMQAEGKESKEKPEPITKDAKLTIRFENVTSEELKKALGQLGIL
jgi:hypothetical protein